MSGLEVTYAGNQQCMALSTKNGKRIAIDCPMTRGEEFGPDNLVAAGLGSCMLLSMAGFAKRHGFDVAGTRIDADVTLVSKPESRISAIDLTVHVPGTFTEEEQAGLERAAASCPIKHSFRLETEISTRFEFGKALAEAV